MHLLRVLEVKLELLLEHIVSHSQRCVRQVQFVLHDTRETATTSRDITIELMHRLRVLEVKLEPLPGHDISRS